MKKETTLFRVEAQPWKPRNYMRRAVKFLLERGCGGLFLDPG